MLSARRAPGSAPCQLLRAGRRAPLRTRRDPRGRGFYFGGFSADTAFVLGKDIFDFCYTEGMGKIYKTSEKSREASRRWRQENPERYRALQLEARARQKIARRAERGRLAIQWEKFRADNPQWSTTDWGRFHKHGVTPADVRRLLAQQGGGCAVCRIPTPPGKKGWHLDHEHTHGAVRGVLCMACNVALGMLKDDPDRCRRAADYLEFGALL
jgi:hypothetical protein